MPPRDKAKLAMQLRDDIDAHRMLAQTQMAHASLNLWRQKYDLAVRHLQQALSHAQDAERAHGALISFEKGQPS